MGACRQQQGSDSCERNNRQVLVPAHTSAHQMQVQSTSPCVPVCACLHAPWGIMQSPSACGAPSAQAFTQKHNQSTAGSSHQAPVLKAVACLPPGPDVSTRLSLNVTQAHTLNSRVGFQAQDPTTPPPHPSLLCWLLSHLRLPTPQPWPHAHAPLTAAAAAGCCTPGCCRCCLPAPAGCAE